MPKKFSITSRSSVFVAAPALLGGVLCLATMSGCGLSRGNYWFRPAAPATPPYEPQGGYVPPYSPSQFPSEAPIHREYSPTPNFEQTPAPVPAERSLPTPVFPNDPPPPSTSEYLSPPSQRPGGVPGQPVYGERPGLISPRNARRLPRGGSERPAAAEMKPDSEPSFENGPVAVRRDLRPLFVRFQQTSANE